MKKHSVFAALLFSILSFNMVKANANTEVHKKCHTFEVELKCIPSKKVSCDKTDISIFKKNNTPIKLSYPTEMKKEGQMPVGFACITSPKDHKEYVLVEYGELPFGCEFCEWFYLYDENGKLLNKNKTAFINIPHHDKGPNNASVNAMFDKLKFSKWPEMDSLSIKPDDYFDDYY